MGNVRWKEVVQDGQPVIKEIHKIVVHRFRISDVDDPDIHAASQLQHWRVSDPGSFVMKHAEDTPIYETHLDTWSYGYSCVVIAELEKAKLAEFYLRWGKLK